MALGQLVPFTTLEGLVAQRVVAAQDVVAVPPRQALDVEEAGPHQGDVRRLEDSDVQVGVDRVGVGLVRDPVEPEHAGVPVDALVQHDVVAALGVVVVHPAAAVEHVGAAVRVVLEGQCVVALHQVGPDAALHPVVQLVAGHDVAGATSAQEVLTVAGEGLGDLLAVQDQVLAAVAEDQVQSGTGVDRVVAAAAVEHVVAEQVGQHVVARPAVQQVVADVALEVVR